MKILLSASRMLQQIDRNTGYKRFTEIFGYKKSDLVNNT